MVSATISGNLVLGYADIGELCGDTQFAVELSEFVNEHLGDKRIICLLAVGDVVVDLAVTAVVRQGVELNDGRRQDRVGNAVRDAKETADGGGSWRERRRA